MKKLTAITAVAASVSLALGSNAAMAKPQDGQRENAGQSAFNHTVAVVNPNASFHAVERSPVLLSDDSRIGKSDGDGSELQVGGGDELETYCCVDVIVIGAM